MDIKTIFTLFALGNVFTIFFFATYILLYGIRKKKLDAYITGKIFQTITWTLFIFRDIFSGPLAIAVSNVFLIFGLTYEIYAMIIANQHFNKKKFIVINIVAALFSLIFAGFASSAEAVRVALMSFFMSSVLIYGGVELLRGSSNYRMQRLTGFLALTMSLFFIARGLHACMFEDSAALYSKNILQVVTYVSLFLVAYSYPIIFLFLLKEQDEITILQNKQQIENDNQTLKELNATKDKLFSIIAHDLRSPYSAILGFADLMNNKKEKNSEKEVAYFTELITKSTKQSYDLLNNLLQWSRIQTGRIQIKPQPLNLNEIVEDVVRLLQANLITKNIELKIDIAKNVTLSADRMMIETIVRNLISNAIKFSHADGIITFLATHTEKHIEIQVSDTGVGISEENINKLFSIEKNYTQVGTYREKGTGLGLILCQEFVTAHNGEIWIESVVDSGTTIHFTIENQNIPSV